MVVQECVQQSGEFEKFQKSGLERNDAIFWRKLSRKHQKNDGRFPKNF